MLGFRGTFLGFTYNGIHSSVLGITRVNNGDRNEKSLMPEEKEIKVEKINNDGAYYFGSSYSKRVFNIDFAFEEISEEQLKKIKLYWNDKKIHELIFDEEPYKVYSAKITSIATMKYVAFDKTPQERVYRGEGSITFTCFYPFARSRYNCIEDYTTISVPEWVSDADQDKYNVLENGEYSKNVVGYLEILNIDDYATIDFVDDNGGNVETYDVNTNYVNVSEWQTASQLPSKKEIGWKGDENKFIIQNVGDLPILPNFYFYLSSAPQNIVITLGTKTLQIQNIVAKIKNASYDKYLLIDFSNQTLFGCNENLMITGNLYNEYVTNRNFFEVPKGKNDINISMKPYKVEFNYLYL